MDLNLSSRYAVKESRSRGERRRRNERQGNEDGICLDLLGGTSGKGYT
jgi:hypothetical protein